MLADQFATAAAQARTLADADEVARLLWRAHAEGHLSDDAATAAAEAVEARRARIKGNRPPTLPRPPTGRRRPVSPDRRASIERRRSVAMSGVVPNRVAAAYTMGENAVLSVIGREVRLRGRCELFVDQIAALAGVSRSLVQEAQRQARRRGDIRVTERRRRGCRSLTNVVEIVSAEWISWLRRGRGGGGCRKNNPTDNKGLYPFMQGEAERSRRAEAARRLDVLAASDDHVLDAVEPVAQPG